MKCSNPKLVLGYDLASGIVAVSGKNGRKIKAAIKDVCFAIINDELAIKFQEAIETLHIAPKNYVDDFHGLSDRPVNLSESERELSGNGEISTTMCINVGDKIEVF